MRNWSTSIVRWVRRTALAAGAVVLWGALTAGTALACSPPSPEPTVTALPDGAIVLVGTTGDKVDGGRLFYVERVYAGDVAASPIVIAFQEGEPIGDCSYPMSSGVRLVIAPDQAPDGTLHANLVTLQADPNTDLGRDFIAQAQARYGDGSVPPGPPGPVSAALNAVDVRLALLGLAIIVGLAAWIGWRRRRHRSPREGAR
jgi:hypothetical protein